MHRTRPSPPVAHAASSIDDNRGMHRPRNRLPRWQRLTLYTAAVTLTATGVAWLALHYTIGAGTGELPHPGEAWLMKLHGAAGFAALFGFGLAAAVHVPRGWHVTHTAQQAGPVRSHRLTGLSLVTLAALLALSAYALYYVAPEALRPALGWTHAALGLAMLGVGLAHRRHLVR